MKTRYDLWPNYTGPRHEYAREKLNEPHRHYHGMEHIHRCLTWLKEGDLTDTSRNVRAQTNVAELQEAIVFHDVVYDHHHQKESRSAEVFEGLHAVDRANRDNYRSEYSVKLVKEMIIATSDHRLCKHPEHTWPMIRIDLADLSLPEQTAINFELIKKESMELYKIDEVEFAMVNLKFMKNLRTTAVENRTLDEDKYDRFWVNVIEGIDLTSAMALDIIITKYLGHKLEK